MVIAALIETDQERESRRQYADKVSRTPQECLKESDQQRYVSCSNFFDYQSNRKADSANICKCLLAFLAAVLIVCAFEKRVALTPNEKGQAQRPEARLGHERSGR